MAVQLSQLPRLARDLRINPVTCEISPHSHPATRVVEAVVRSSTHESARLYYLLCDDALCLADAQQLADSHCPYSVEDRDLTVLELEAISGMDVTGHHHVLPSVAVLGGAA